MAGKPPEYLKRSWADELFNPPPPEPRTLKAGICAAFPDANPKKLAAWVKKIRASTKSEPELPELLLFSALICGIHFRITHPEVVSVLEDLWKWLTWHPRNMKPDLAELLIEAWTPGVTRAVERRGWQRGWPGGPHIRARGHPPTARGAWVAALLAEHYLRETAVQKAVVHATALASVLLGREAEPNEFYKFRGEIAEGVVGEIARMIAERYEWSVEQDGVRQRDFAPLRFEKPSEEPLRLMSVPRPEATLKVLTIRGLVKEYPEWRERHKALSATLSAFTCEGVARGVLEKIPDKLWEPLWGVREGGPKTR